MNARVDSASLLADRARSECARSMRALGGAIHLRFLACAGLLADARTLEHGALTPYLGSGHR